MYLFIFIVEDFVVDVVIYYYDDMIVFLGLMNMFGIVCVDYDFIVFGVVQFLFVLQGFMQIVVLFVDG